MKVRGLRCPTQRTRVFIRRSMLVRLNLVRPLFCISLVSGPAKEIGRVGPLTHIKYTFSTQIHADLRRWRGRSRPLCCGGHILVEACSGWSGCISCLASAESHRTDPACCLGAHILPLLYTQILIVTSIISSKSNHNVMFIFLDVCFEIIMPMTSYRCHAHEHTHIDFETPTLVRWYETRVGWFAAVMHFPEQVRSVCVGVRCWHRTFWLVCTCGWVICSSCVCVCIFLFVWKGVEVGNISLKCLHVDLSSRKEDAPNLKAREDQFTQFSPLNKAKLFWSPSSDVTETDWRTFILVSLQDKTTQWLSCSVLRLLKMVRYCESMHFLTRPVQLSRCNRAREVHWWTRGAGQPKKTDTTAEVRTHCTALTSQEVY